MEGLGPCTGKLKEIQAYCPHPIGKCWDSSFPGGISITILSFTIITAYYPELKELKVDINAQNFVLWPSN